MTSSKSFRTGLAVLAGLMAAVWVCLDAQAEVVAGRVAFARGACAASLEGQAGAPRLLGANAEVYEGDIIQTGADSFVVVEFVDKARITIRPNSSFRVQKYSTEGAAEAKLVLEKGAIDAKVGRIAKAGTDKFQVETPMAAIKSQGADFNAHLCDQECADKAAAAGAAKPDDSVARVVQAQGGVEAIAENGAPRALSVGQALFEKERVRSQNDAYAVLVFRDGSKTTVQPGSEVEITAFRYQPGDNANNRQWLKLIAGGVRALTGAIGKEHKENVQLATPVATIGIRGTLLYHHHLPAPLDGSPAGGYTHVTQGAVSHSNATGVSELGTGKTGYFANFNSTQTVLATPPVFMQRFEQMTPSPADVQANPALFSGGVAKAAASLTVRAKGDGKVTVSDKQGGKTELGDKQTAKTSSDGSVSSTEDGGDDAAPGGMGGGLTSGAGGDGNASGASSADSTGDDDDDEPIVPAGSGSGGGSGGDASAAGC